MSDIKVDVVQRKKNAVLVEYREDNERVRKIVPAGDLDSKRETVDELALARGIPYGLPWEDLITLSATPEKVAHELRRRDIWTYEDLTSRPQEAQGAIMAVYGLDVAALLRAIADKN